MDESQITNICTFDELANALEIEPSKLRYILWGKKPPSYYSRFTIPKANGTKRQISAPQGPIKVLQYRLLRILNAYYSPKRVVHGFTKGRSIVSNANSHINKNWVVNIDIKDFFPSINFGRVRGLFLKSFPGMTKESATAIAQLTSVFNSLPQGAPTSPIISNMICSRLDRDLMDFARQDNIKYSRYADDITLSGDGAVRSSIGEYSNGLLVLSSKCIKIFNDNGFQINSDKVRVSFKYRRQEVTGLVVNSKINVSRKYIRNLRALLHNIETLGLSEAQELYTEKYHGRGSLQSYIHGKLLFLRMVRGSSDNLYDRLVNSFNLNIADRPGNDSNTHLPTRAEIKAILSRLDPSYGNRYHRIWRELYDETDSTGENLKTALYLMREVIGGLIRRFAKNESVENYLNLSPNLRITRLQRCKYLSEKSLATGEERLAKLFMYIPGYYNDLNKLHSLEIVDKVDVKVLVDKVNELIIEVVKSIEMLELFRLS
ncbi:RNA-directed DNA polymerase [Candidatus Dojkabacteria bacterium]|nr:RNA-directed DNA polymerase [Candidatus Dojkabacteria bacterium]